MKLATLALLTLAACAPEEAPRSAPPPPAEPDSFGWSVNLVELCGRPYTSFIVDGGEFECFMVDGAWHLRSTGERR